MRSFTYVVAVRLIHDFFCKPIWCLQYKLGNVSILLTGCAGSVTDSISCAYADVLASFAFVTQKWLVFFWCGEPWVVYFCWCVYWNRSCLKAGRRLGEVFSMFLLKDEYLFMYKQALTLGGLQWNDAAVSVWWYRCIGFF